MYPKTKGQPKGFILINRTAFFTGYRKAWGPLSQSQADGLNVLLGYYEADPSMIDPRWAAYSLATEKHECADRWHPIEEFGKGKGKPYGQPVEVGLNAHSPSSHLVVYYGRGRVQLTWKPNYRKMTERIREVYPDRVAVFEQREARAFDMIFMPEQALDPEVSYLILSLGMREGIFTGRKLSDYINETTCDYLNARRIINGLDQARLIASYAVKFEAMLK